MTLKIQLGSVYNINDYDELIRMFIPRGSYELVYEKVSEFEGIPEKLKKARNLYAFLSNETGKKLPWGVLTGVKPTKLYAQLCSNNCESMKNGLSTHTFVKKILKNEYLVSDEKIGLLKQIYDREILTLQELDYGKPCGLYAGEAVAVYIGIPFCPSRCEYCTFVSGVGDDRQMKEYLDALNMEISYVSRSMKERKMNAESVYIGGGTPTSLPVSMLNELLMNIRESFVSENTEFTVEAGRPDSITFEKAVIISKAGAKRISVNPQSMNDRTLQIIKRAHKATDIYNAFENTKAAGIQIINSDIIAGLPGEAASDFLYSLEKILNLKPENITIHTLALKKGAQLREKDPMYSYNRIGVAEDMLKTAVTQLTSADMQPYYLYRQKQTVDNLENTGYTIPGAECVYNMRMMQEKQSVIALGAGAVSRIYYPNEDRVERVFNIADTILYIKRIDEMLERKRRVFKI